MSHLLEISQQGGYGKRYPHSSTSFDLFSTYFGDNQIQPFSNIRFYYFYPKDYAVNLGLGIRSINDKANIVWGGNIYYDFRKTAKLKWHQLGAGLEILGNLLSFRINAYLPLQKEQKQKLHLYDSFIGDFFATCRRHEFALGCIESEIELRSHFSKSIILSIYTGSYYLFSSRYHSYALGGLLRVRAELGRYFYIEAISSYDSIFHQFLQGKIIFSIPLINPFSLYAVKPVQRQGIIQIIHDYFWNYNW